MHFNRHLDGNHKLIRWRMVVHGGVDGFSRAVVFLRCSNNNEASTVLEQFFCGTRKFYFPRRIRTDHRTENVEVARYMLSKYSIACNPVLLQVDQSTIKEQNGRGGMSLHMYYNTTTIVSIFLNQRVNLIQTMKFTCLPCSMYLCLDSTGLLRASSHNGTIIPFELKGTRVHYNYGLLVFISPLNLTTKQ